MCEAGHTSDTLCVSLKVSVGADKGLGVTQIQGIIEMSACVYCCCCCLDTAKLCTASVSCVTASASWS